MEEKKKELLQRFGKHLKELRAQKSISGAELARRCYMDKPNMARIERGETNPTLETLDRLAKGLEIKLEDLMRGL